MLKHLNMKRLVETHGINVTYKKFTQGTYDYDTGTASGSNVSRTVKVYFYDFKAEEIDGTNVVYGDRKVVMSTYDSSNTFISEPEPGDFFEGVKGPAKVKGLSTIYNGVAILYLLHVGA